MSHLEQVLMYYGGEPPHEGSHWRKYKCPFHEDTRASASTREGAFKCHGCGVKGGPFALVLIREGRDSRRAAEVWVKITGENARTYRDPRSDNQMFDFERGSGLFPEWM